MTIETGKTVTDDVTQTQGRGGESLTRNQLPSWAPWAVLAGSLVLVALLQLITGGFSIALLLVGGAVVYGIATYVLSRSSRATARPPTGS